MTEFEGVVPALGKALAKRGYLELTPVQLDVLKPEIIASDALVSAQTGSGKTVAFGLSMAPTLLEGADRLTRTDVPMALVVAPTRELALQVKRELEWLYAEAGAHIVSCVGGMDMGRERRELSRGAHIVVGTPGRLRDHLERKSLKANELKVVVLDEADEMLDMGFRDDLEFILETSPETRRTLMFSATVPRSIMGMAKRYQRDAIRVNTASEHKQHLDIEYRALTIANKDQENAIVNVLRYYDAKNAIVFCSTRATVNHMTSRFNNRGLSVVALSGELSQNERTHALQAMRDGRARVCVATDVASRGLDLPNLDLVIHAEIPKNREILLHRSGRTGRAGRKGVCTLIVPNSARRRTERLLQAASVEAEWAKPPSAADIVDRDRRRMMDDPALTEALSDDEQAFAAELLALHSPEHIAAAFVRQHLAGQTAPEELRDSGPESTSKPRERDRDGFKDSQWISVSVGRKHKAEARWLMPMLCKAGDITKRDIGAIRIQDTETWVEITAASIDKFLGAVGPSRRLEKDVTITKLNKAPTGAAEPRREKSYGKKRDFNKGRRSDGYDKRGPKRTFEVEPDKIKGRESRDDTRGDKWDDDKPRKAKPYKARDKGRAAGDDAGKPEWKKKAHGGDDTSKPEWKKKARAADGDKPADAGRKDDAGFKRKPSKPKATAGGPSAKKRWEKAGKKPKSKKAKLAKQAKLAKKSAKGGSATLKRKK